MFRCYIFTFLSFFFSFSTFARASYGEGWLDVIMLSIVSLLLKTWRFTFRLFLFRKVQNFSKSFLVIKSFKKFESFLTLCVAWKVQKVDKSWKTFVLNLKNFWAFKNLIELVNKSFVFSSWYFFFSNCIPKSQCSVQPTFDYYSSPTHLSAHLLSKYNQRECHEALEKQ